MSRWLEGSRRGTHYTRKEMEMVTGYEVEMYHNISRIARALDRIANCMEAAELRARASDPQTPVQAGTSHGVQETTTREEGK